MGIKEMMSKFSIAQMTSNDSGKTSASGTMGCLICTAATVCFIWGGFTKQAELVNQAIAYTAIGAGLLGYRKSKVGKSEIKEEAPAQAEEPAQEPQKDQPLNS